MRATKTIATLGPASSSPEIAAYPAARVSKAAAIVVFTTSGLSPRIVSRYRPPVRILAITPSESVAGSSRPVLLERRYLQPQDRVVIVAGQPACRAGTTNILKMHVMGESR